MKKRISQTLAICQNTTAERLLKMKKSKRDEVADTLYIKVDAKTTGSVSKSGFEILK